MTHRMSVKSPRTERILLLIAATLICLVAVAIARDWFVASAFVTSIAPATPETSSMVPATTQGNNPAERLDVALITIRPTGFEPTEITRTNGRFLLVVENRSGLEELHLNVTRQQGEHVSDAHFSRHLLDWRGLITLPPGQYVITEANRPAWHCRITVNN
jgi:hypothetical protein